MPCVKRLNRLRIVPSVGKRFIPNSAPSPRSARSIELCANRLAPATTAIRNAVKVSPAGIAFGEFKQNGRSRRTRSGKPICFKNSMNTLSPPNGVTARGVWRKTPFFSPQNTLTYSLDLDARRAFVSIGGNTVGRTYSGIGKTSPVGQYTLANIRFAIPVDGHLSLFATVDNLFDRRYEVLAGYPMPGTNAAGGIDLKF